LKSRNYLISATVSLLLARKPSQTLLIGLVCWDFQLSASTHAQHKMSSNSYVIEYAKTARASCKNKPCKDKKIEKDSVRVGKVSPNPFSEGDFKTEYAAL
jgi:hypothetical protein